MGLRLRLRSWFHDVIYDGAMDLSSDMCMSRLLLSVFGFNGIQSVVFKLKRHGL
ncbi:hypothetical protein AALP_AA4G180800 [Arabis alpina]|uniref:Uncharacterized protein n=1 Tax=Arabis alpina TaxID=50452 RepID=A0A087H406_ARAAL|nr:hypothetical protein AALP_AA4G180800 [Arabis alpina]